ncbi:MAG: tetratricopeptide repeat protein [bacterium]
MSKRTSNFIITVAVLLAIAVVLWVTQIKHQPTQQTTGQMPSVGESVQASTQTKSEGKKSPDQIEYENIRQLFISGDLEKAIDEFTKFIQKYPKSQWADDAQFDIAQCYEHMGEKDKAIKEYQKLIDKYPQSELKSAAQYAIDVLEGRVSQYGQ